MATGSRFQAAQDQPPAAPLRRVGSDGGSCLAVATHYFASTLQLVIDYFVRCFFYPIKQVLTDGLVRLAQMNWSEPAHSKFTHHLPRDLHRSFNIV